MSEVRKRKPDRDDSKSKRPSKVKQEQAKSDRVTQIGTVFIELFRVSRRQKFRFRKFSILV